MKNIILYTLISVILSSCKNPEGNSNSPSRTPSSSNLESRTCSVQPSNSIGGTELSNDGGITWTSCVGFICSSGYAKISNSCIQINQTRSCTIQPANSTGGTEASNDGGQTWGSCAGFTCGTGYTSNGSGCNINSYSVDVNKLISRGVVNDITLGLLTMDANTTNGTASYNYNQMIVFEATPSAGYTITGWTGCDSVSGDFTRCTISNISSNRTIAPVFEASYLTLSVSWADVNLGNASNGFSIYKNGSLCSGGCLSSLILTDNIEIIVDVGSYLNDVSDWGLTGNYSSYNDSIPNKVSFQMGTANVSASLVLSDKTVLYYEGLPTGTVVRRTDSAEILGDYKTTFETTATLYDYVEFHSTLDPVKLEFINDEFTFVNDRSIIVYSDLNCTNVLTSINSIGDTGPLSMNISLNIDSTKEYSFKYRNVINETACFRRKFHHMSNLTITTESYTLNKPIENSSGYLSFFTDSTNEIQVSCVDQAELGNPLKGDYNYGKESFLYAYHIKAYTNADLVTPYYTQSFNNNENYCIAGKLKTITTTNNVNFSTADVIKIEFIFKNKFGAKNSQTITTNIEKRNRNCVITNGVGTQAYINNGTYTSCTVVSCNGGYTQIGNTCVETNQSRSCTIQPENSTGGQETSSDGGQTWSACTGFTCNGGFDIAGNICVEQGVERFSAGTSHTCAISNNEITYCWGSSISGEGGRNAYTDQYVPVAINTSGVLAGKKLKTITAGDEHTCAISTEGKAYCWGKNNFGQLGNNSTSNSPVAVEVYSSGALSGKILKKISAGKHHTCALASDGTAYCWGYNTRGEVSASYTNELVPVSIDQSGILLGKTIKDIQAGIYFTCAVTTEDLMYCWGSNGYGELGNGNNTTSEIPTMIDFSGILNGKTITKMAVQYTTSPCVIASDNKLYCWGYGTTGELGDGTNATKNVASMVDTSGVFNNKNIAQIATGYSSSCALTTDNIIGCWGENYYGEVGNGTNTSTNIPLATTMTGVLNGKTIKNINMGHSHICVTDTNFDMYCWGRGSYGQIGDNGGSSRNTPRIVSGGYKFY